MIYCKNCNSEVPTGDVCPNCGTIVDYQVLDSDGKEVKPKNPGNVLGIVSLILGCLSLVFPLGCCMCSCISSLFSLMIPVTGMFASIVQIVLVGLSLVFGVVGLILAIIGKKKSKAVGMKNTMATVGLITSIFGIAFAVIGIALIIIGFIAGLGLGLFSIVLAAFSSMMSAMESTSGYYY